MNVKERFDIFFSIIEDPRNKSYTKYNLTDILFIIMCGILCGCNDIEKIVAFAQGRITFFKKYLDINTIPCLSTLIRVLAIIDPYKLSISIIAIMKYVIGTDTKDAERQVMIDGKTICSTAKMKSYEKPLHIVTALLGDTAMSLGQITVQDKSNEIPAVRELLEVLDLRNTVVTMDAMHCQKETVEKIVDLKGDYVVQLKANQGNFYEDVYAMFDDKYMDIADKDSEYEIFKTVDKNGGRIETRTCYVLNEVEFFTNYLADWKGLKKIFAIKREVETNGKKSIEISCYLSSKNVCAEKLLEYTRKHWQIESFHWILDVNFEEDKCRIQNRKAIQNLNILRKIAINIHKTYIEKMKLKKNAISASMFNCLINETELEKVLNTI